MTGGRWLGLGLLCAALGLFALPGAAAGAARHHRHQKATESFVEEPEAPHATIYARGTNGYRITLSIESGDASILIQRDGSPESYVVYGVPNGSIGGGRVHARFGRIAQVSARFVPSGKARRSRASGCRGGAEVTRFGNFIGTIRFEGEEGFSRFSGRRARGEITSAPRRFCRTPKERIVPPPRESGPPHFLTGFFAGATEGETTTVLAVSHRELEPRTASFHATSTESRGNMQIFREVSVEAPAADFAFADSLDMATIAPPAPFSGSATFTRIDDFATRWEGSLSVSFPGRANVPLTGRGYSWYLERARDQDPGAPLGGG